MLCYAMLCYAMLCYVMLCYAMLCYVMLCYVMLCYVMLCYAMLCYVMLCHVILCYVILCYLMLCYIILCCILRHNIGGMDGLHESTHVYSNQDDLCFKGFLSQSDRGISKICHATEWCMSSYLTICTWCNTTNSQGPLLLAWFNFNPSMNK